ncbi:uncharacterized protein FOMMEDRAFT_80660, partial [Fomitiporia mediterranea MF3/22]|uniref:uncharacterized protein n=1 Tax=Fomitiporia mediterranea (strain MF3/22) TaxID=694068 RepID=UPI00044074A4
MTCEPARHSSLWFDDGNVILLASTNQLDPPGLLFRIHKSVLSKHSEVFRDMFTLPTSEDRGHSTEDQNETYDGTALIRMPDTAEQIEAMIKAFYEPLYLEFDNRDPDLPLQLTPLMAMVRKYEIKEIGSHLENRFKAAWPKTLEEWDEID